MKRFNRIIIRMKENTNRAMVAIGAIAMITSLWAFVGWTEKRDVKLIEWAEKYEECVEDKYNTTPTAWYLEHGTYPDCQINTNQK